MIAPHASHHFVPSEEGTRCDQCDVSLGGLASPNPCPAWVADNRERSLALLREERSARATEAAARARAEGRSLLWPLPAGGAAAMTGGPSCYLPPPDATHWQVSIVHCAAPHPIGGSYVRRWWLPTLGPTATALLQLLTEPLAAEPPPPAIAWELSELACCLGVGHKGGRHSPLYRSLERLAKFRVLEVGSNDRLYVRSHLQSIDGRQRARLTPAALAAHQLEEPAYAATVPA